MRKFLLITGIISLLGGVILVGFGILHLSETIGATTISIAEREGVTYFALFFEILFGALFTALGVYLLVKRQNYYT